MEAGQSGGGDGGATWGGDAREWDKETCVELCSRGMRVRSVGKEEFRKKEQVWMPLMGLGLSYQQCSYGEREKKALPAIEGALQCGYRHLDTASRYQTETYVGAALQKLAQAGGQAPPLLGSGGVSDRQDVFLTSKLWPAHYNEAERHYEAACERMGTSSLDLFLLHWPEPFGSSYRSNREARAAVWRKMELLWDAGKCRAVGVSNFLVEHLSQLEEDCSILPHVNQVQFSPIYQPRDVMAACRDLGIVVEGYSPLAKGRALGLDSVHSIASRHSVTAAQVILRWSLQRNVVTIPKASSALHLGQNIDVFGFHLSQEEVESIDREHRGISVTWDPRGIP